MIFGAVDIFPFQESFVDLFQCFESSRLLLIQFLQLNFVSERISIYDSQAIESWRRQFGIDPAQIRKLRNAFFKRFIEDSRLINEFSSHSKEEGSQVQLAFDQLGLHCLEIAQQCDSEIDGATKLLMRTIDGLLLETVILRIETGRTTLCVSSQVGCAAACDFCATGKMGVARNLDASQILDQVVLAGQLLAKEDRRLRNIVFMGMGEPFHNETGLFETLESLTSPEIFNHPPTRILVSSVGVTDGMIRCAERFPDVNQALSLHSADQTTREKLIPLSRKYQLDQLQSAIKTINDLQSCPFMIEYLMLSGMNDSEDDARQLIDWLKGLHVHVNLIPYNPIDSAPHLTGSEPDSIHQFANLLKASGLKTTTRYSLGKDIAAACGQLVQKENRRIAKALSIN